MQATLADIERAFSRELASETHTEKPSTTTALPSPADTNRSKCLVTATPAIPSFSRAMKSQLLELRAIRVRPKWRSVKQALDVLSGVEFRHIRPSVWLGARTASAFIFWLSAPIFLGVCAGSAIGEVADPTAQCFPKRQLTTSFHFSQDPVTSEAWSGRGAIFAQALLYSDSVEQFAILCARTSHGPHHRQRSARADSPVP